MSEFIKTLYHVICTYTAPPENNPHQYDFETYLFSDLHIHILDSSITTHPTALLPSQKSGKNTLFQWGTPQQLAKKTRYPCITEKSRRTFGSIGIGSIASGQIETTGNFIGGGEGFIWHNQAFRVTKGGLAFPIHEDEQYWFLQIAEIKTWLTLKPFVFSGSRKELVAIFLHALQKKHTFFIAAFNCYFYTQSFRAKSSGIFKTDRAPTPTYDLFDHQHPTAGGHLLDYAEKNLAFSIIGDVSIAPITHIFLMNEKITIPLHFFSHRTSR